MVAHVGIEQFPIRQDVLDFGVVAELFAIGQKESIVNEHAESDSHKELRIRGNSKDGLRSSASHSSSKRPKAYLVMHRPSRMVHDPPAVCLILPSRSGVCRRPDDPDPDSR